MTYRLSRLMSAATACYGGYALAEPRHLGRAMTDDGRGQAQYDVLAQTYGCRDLTVSAFGMFGRSERTVTTAMLIRIAFDVSDGLLLAVRAEDDEVRTKVLGVTMGWAGLNTLALLIDRRRARTRA
ncbi:MAG: hypothetical protein WB441_05525 [Nocardioidaceae bacterium]